MFLWGWLFGGVVAMFQFFWLWFLVVPVQPATRVLLNLGVVLLFAYLGLYTAVFALLVRRFGLWSAPLVWPLVEFLRSQLQIAFPWDLLGYTMTPYTRLIQPAAIGGVYLVSAWVVLVSLLLYKLATSRPRRAYLAATLAAFLAPLAFSFFTLKPDSPWFRVAIIQPDVSPLDKGDWDSRERIQADLVQMTREAAASRPELILYPETATLVDVTRSSTIGPALQHLVDSLGIEVFTGTPLRDEQHGSGHNGAVLIRPGEWPPRQRYYKIRLTPFSEKIPYVDELPILRRLIGTADMGDWTRGWNLTVFDWRLGKLSGLICYEAIFPDYARRFALRGSELFAVVTNDGWFGRVLGAQQHAELAVMRTVENGIPMIRSANNGISFIIDPYGRVLKQTRLFTRAILVGTVPRPIGPTLYRRWGDWFMYVCLGGIAVGLVLKRLAGSRAARKPSHLQKPS